MKPTLTGTYHIAYKWLSWCIVLAMLYYWLLTVGLVFFSKPLSTAIPHQTILYRTFARQNWRLFAVSKVYNRQMLFITRDKQLPAQADTTDLVQYLLTEKRAFAPFNNYEDALDRILYIVMNGVETQMLLKKPALEKKVKGESPGFYLDQTSMMVEADSQYHYHIDNIAAFGKYMMEQKKIRTAGKEYQLIITHKFIAPSAPPANSVFTGDVQTIFISTYKPL